MKATIDLFPIPTRDKPGTDAPRVGDCILWIGKDCWAIDEDYQGTLAPIGMSHWGRVDDMDLKG
jgi:hypothetical protein